MASKNYNRAQTMVMLDKYNMAKNQFHADMTDLAKRYFEVDSIVEETYASNGLQIVLTVSVKKVKDLKRVLA